MIIFGCTCSLKVVIHEGDMLDEALLPVRLSRPIPRQVAGGEGHSSRPRQISRHARKQALISRLPWQVRERTLLLAVDAGMYDSASGRAGQLVEAAASACLMLNQRIFGFVITFEQAVSDCRCESSPGHYCG